MKTKPLYLLDLTGAAAFVLLVALLGGACDAPASEPPGSQASICGPLSRLHVALDVLFKDLSPAHVQAFLVTVGQHTEE